jgi:hypothetical protein
LDIRYSLAACKDAHIAEKATALLAEVQTDAEGNASVELGEKQGCNGEAFEVDVYCGTVARQKPGRVPPKPPQITNHAAAAVAPPSARDAYLGSRGRVALP